MKHILFFATFFSIAACNTPVKKDTAAAENENDQVFFPVKDFLLSQVKKVDSFQYPITKYEIKTTDNDTIAIDMATFKQLASPFLELNLNKENFKESSFADQSIPSVTLNYTNKNATALYQRVDVIISPKAASNDEVRSIYMELTEEKNDGFILRKLYWRADKNFQIITTTKTKNSNEVTEHLKVVWDPAE